VHLSFQEPHFQPKPVLSPLGKNRCGAVRLFQGRSPHGVLRPNGRKRTHVSTMSAFCM